MGRKRKFISMKLMTARAYRNAMINNIYSKLVSGDIDIRPTLQYFNAQADINPCETIILKFRELLNSDFMTKERESEFIMHFSIYFALMDIFKNLLDLASPDARPIDGITYWFSR